jgi:hypothetical protein
MYGELLFVIWNEGGPPLWSCIKAGKNKACPKTKKSTFFVRAKLKKEVPVFQQPIICHHLRKHLINSPCFVGTHRMRFVARRSWSIGYNPNTAQHRISWNLPEDLLLGCANKFQKIRVIRCWLLISLSYPSIVQIESLEKDLAFFSCVLCFSEFFEQWWHAKRKYPC